MKSKKIYICLICKKNFSRIQNKESIPRYCSMPCYGKSRVGKDFGLNKKVKKDCLVCRKKFMVSPYRKKTANYCSRKCTYKEHGEKVSREKSHLWKGGISFLGQSARNTPEYKRWRLAVYKRDNFTCQMCGQKGKNLNANHIKKFSDYPDLRFSISNGITLCKLCHKEVTWHEQEYEQYFYSILRD